MPMLRLGTALHRGIYRLSRGRMLARLGPMPVLELTTTGRRTGRPRPTMLTAPVTDGDTLVVVASAGGSDHHPQWFLNLRAHPSVSVTMDGATRPMLARVATTAEHDALWPRIIEAYPRYGSYRSRTERDIPVVVLEPVENRPS